MPDSKTAFAEALEASASSGTPAKFPSYITAADTLNIANKNKTFVEGINEGVGNVNKFITASLISGANELYHIPANIGNAFGGDFKVTETQSIINSLDSDLGKFYQENQQSVDLAGFLVSSVVPGSAGVKLLNLGQKSLRGAIGAGKFGANMGKALGLLAPSKQNTLAAAVKAVSNNSAPASLLHRNSLKHIGAGFGQNFYEALAFEVAVSATLFESPVLENQDFGDFVSNVAWGAGVFGLVGGALDAAKINSAIKKAADTAAVEARPWQFIDEAASASTTYEKLATDIEQLRSIPDIPVGLDPSREQFLRNAAKTKEVKLQGRIKTNLRALAKEDLEASSTLFRGLKTASKNDQLNTVIGLEEVGRFSYSSPLANRSEQLFKKVSDGKATVKEIEEFAASDVHVNYVKAWGEDVGTSYIETPTITSLIDTTKKGETIQVNSRGVQAGKRKYSFDTKWNTTAGTKGKPFDIRKVDKFEADARYIWAQKLELDSLIPKAGKTLVVNVDDFPLMERVINDFTEEQLKQVRFSGVPKGMALTSDLKEFLTLRKLAVAEELSMRTGKGKLNQEEIASIVNTKSKFLSGELAQTADSSAYHVDDIMARQAHQRDYTQKLIDQGDWDAKKGLIDIYQVPQTLKLVYNGAPKEGMLPLKGVNNFVAENMVIIKEQQKLYQEGVDRAVAATLGAEEFSQLAPITSGQVFQGAVPSGAGHGFATAASSNYGTLASTVENIGAQTSRMIERAKDRTRTALEPLLYKLGNNQAAAIEWSTLNARVRGIEGNYSLNAAGDALEPTLIKRWKEAVKAATAEGKPAPKAPVLPNPNMEMSIPLKSKEVRDLVAAHIEINGGRTSKMAGIRTAQGTQFNRSPDVFYPIPIDPKEFPYFALVTDRSITSGNHTKTLYASSAEELDDMIKKLKDNPQLEIKTKGEAEQYFKDEGIWDYEKSLNDNYLDTMAHRKGVSAPYFVATDPQKITSDMLKWHMQRETGLVREAISAKYQVQFEELRRLGEEFTNVETSKFSGRTIESLAESAANNPFGDYIKTALAIRKDASYPWWVQTNQMADKALSRVLKKASEIVESSKSPEELAGVNKLLQQAGYKGAAYDESMELFANVEPASGALRAAVQKANSILATVVLRWDALNAMNNAVSANVLLGAETKAVIRAIQRGDSAAVGALAELTQIKVPGTDRTMFSANKLIANSVKKFAANTAEAQKDMKWFRDNGYITSISAQYRDAIDSLTFTGKESVKNWDARINKLHTKLRDAADTGEKWTGNKLAEEFNRFVAADVMKQMTDVAIEAGVMTAKEQRSYINTFVNRTQGNYLAAQRPMMFQGPVGQAIGLFQTYQFNLIQQLLRHVGEGNGKDAMTLLALQGTIHGMNGLPAFNAINTHLVGTASGNSEHRDFYTETYRAAGKEAGDWLMYGLASNMLGLIDPELKVNLYTRGDINPRHLTIVPTDPSQVPIVQASAKVFSNLFTTAGQLAAGGDISSTLLNGMQNNGISRPLAGLAQTLRGLENVEQASYSTTKQGNIIAANDLVSLTSLVRVVGGKPLDEAVAMDALFRNKLYANKDSNKRSALGMQIKAKLLAGEDISAEDVEEFAGKYAESGGRQEQFNQWFSQLYKTANTSQVNQLKNGLESSYSKSMQLIMGGEDLRDFSGQVTQ